MAQQKKEGMSWNAVVMLAVFVVVAGATIYAVQNFLPKEHSVYGVKVYSAGDPLKAMKGVLKSGNVIEQQLYSQADERNSDVILFSAEIANVYASQGKAFSTYVYLVDQGKAFGALLNSSNIAENKTCGENACVNPDVVIKYDSCNCLKVENNKLYVLFDRAFARDNNARLRVVGIIGGALTQSK